MYPKELSNMALHIPAASFFSSCRAFDGTFASEPRNPKPQTFQAFDPVVLSIITRPEGEALGFKSTV